MGRFHWLLATLLITAAGFGFSATATTAEGCIPAEEMTEIASKFNQFNDLAGREFCYNGTQGSALLEAIMFMRHTRFDEAMPKSSDELFSGTFADDWWGYFTQRINRFEIDNNCPKGVGAYVFIFGGPTMYVCTMMLNDVFAAMDRVSIFMHEARHLDGFPHTTCSQGPRAGLRGACDNHISQGGSYAVTVETYAQMAKYGPDLHPAMRAYARSASIIYADEAFEVPTQIDREDHLLLMTSSREFYRLSLDGSHALERLGDSPSLGRIVLRGRHMMLVPEDRSLDAQYVFARNEGEIVQTPHEFAVDYNAQPPEVRAELVDMHLAAQWTARIYKTHVRLTCDPRSSNFQDIPTALVPAALIYPEGFSRSVKTAQLITESGAILDFGCDSSGMGFVSPSTLVLDQPYKRVYKSGAVVVGLTAAGQLFKINGPTSEPLATEVDGRVYEIAPMQSYGFFGL